MNNASRENLLLRIRSLLRCPVCHARLVWENGRREIPCTTCGLSFPVLPGDVPVMLPPQDRARFERLLNEDPDARRMVREYGRHGTWRAKVRNFFKPPSIVYDVDVARRYSWIYDTRGPETLVLSIGGGPGRENPRVINLNLDAFDSVDIVGDGTNIPLVDEAVDTVTANAVIEHIPKPLDLLNEIYRVLKVGGYAQLMVPFVFPFHAYPSDFQRYSAGGVLEITRSFEKVELCVLTGPASAMNVLFREFLRLLVPMGNHGLMRPLLNGVSGWLTFPFKYLDVWLNRKPEAGNLAAEYFARRLSWCFRS